MNGTLIATLEDGIQIFTGQQVHTTGDFDLQLQDQVVLLVQRFRERKAKGEDVLPGHWWGDVLYFTEEGDEPGSVSGGLILSIDTNGKAFILPWADHVVVWPNITSVKAINNKLAGLLKDLDLISQQ